MAEFTINIEHIAPSYSRVSTALIASECVLQDRVDAVAMDSVSPGIVYGVIARGTYTGDPWKTLHIDSAVNNYQFFKLLYDENPITEPIDIDIEGLGANDAIPLLTIDSSGSSDIKNTRTVTLIFSISDTSDIEGPTLSSSLQLIGSKCEESGDSDPTISNKVYSEGDCTGGEKINFTVNGEANTTYKYQIATISNGNHGYTATLQNTDTLSYISPSSASGTGATTTGNVTTNGSGEINLSWEVCPRPPLNDGDNCVSVYLTLFKEDGITLNTLERLSANACYLN